ncbi:MAG: plastocyanin/azurin family copper-binding protein [Gaiellaceae bacterium]
MSRIAALASAIAAASLVAAVGGSAAPEQTSQLFATVGPGFTINLRDASGARVSKLDPGAYVIEVEDLSEEHNFHLSGSGLNRATEIGETGKATWTVTFTDGTYRYVCDPHSGTMNGSFAVGNVTTPPPTPPPGARPVTSKSKLQLTSGPGFTITLTTTAGRAVKSMRTGTYAVVVRDRSRIHNAHLVAPGYNRATKPLTYSGSQTWRVKLARVGTLRFLCDPHALQGMKGSAKIVR